MDEVEFAGEDPWVLGVVDDEVAVWWEEIRLDGRKICAGDFAVGVLVAYASCKDDV